MSELISCTSVSERVKLSGRRAVNPLCELLQWWHHEHPSQTVPTWAVWSQCFRKYSLSAGHLWLHDWIWLKICVFNSIHWVTIIGDISDLFHGPPATIRRVPSSRYPHVEGSSKICRGLRLRCPASNVIASHISGNGCPCWQTPLLYGLITPEDLSCFHSDVKTVCALGCSSHWRALFIHVILLLLKCVCVY